MQQPMAKKNKIHPPPRRAPFRRRLIFMTVRVVQLHGRVCDPKVVVGGTDHASNCVIMWLIPSRLLPRNDRMVVGLMTLSPSFVGSVVGAVLIYYDLF